MPGNASGTTDHAVAADASAASNADTTGDHGIRADEAVVTDLDLIVELDTGLHDGVAHRSAIDRRVRADLDVVTDHDTTESAES